MVAQKKYKKSPTLLLHPAVIEGERVFVLSVSAADKPYVVLDKRLPWALNLLPEEFTENIAKILWSQKKGLQGIANELWDFLVSENLVLDKASYRKKITSPHWYQYGWHHAGSYHESTRNYPFMNMNTKNSLREDNQVMKQYALKDAPPSAYQVFNVKQRVKLEKLDADSFDNGFIESLTAKDRLGIKGLSVLFDGVFGQREKLEYGYHKNMDILQMEVTKKAVPSGGGRHPTEIFLLNFGQFDIAQGVYHYNVRDNSLDRIRDGNLWNHFQKICPSSCKPKPKAAFAITSMCERAMWRYRDPRSWRAVMIDAGHALHMYKRVAGMLGLESKTSQRFKSTEVAKVLGINAIEQPVLSVGIFTGDVQ